MDAELKRKWVEALRSGNYKQCEGYLTKDGAYCCLGVLASISGAEWITNDHGYTAPYVGGAMIAAGGKDFPDDLLSDDFVQKYGLIGQMVLSKMNDEGRTFPEIADFIVANL